MNDFLTNQMPNNWKKEFIGDITNNLDSIRIPLNSQERAKKEGQGAYPYIGANNILGYIDEYIFDEKIICIAEDGGSWGHNQTCAFIVNEKCWVNNHAHVLTAKNNLILEYFKYYLNYADLSLHINGATRGKLNQSALRKIKIPLPPLAEQQKIASILDAADSLRQKDQQLIEKYTELSQSLFLEMFGDPVSNPMGWDKKLLSDVGTIYTGNTPPRANLEYYGNGIEWIKTNNINTPNMYLTVAEESLSNAGLSIGRCVEKNSLLVTCIAGSKKVIGNVAIADRKVAFNQQINSFTPFKGNILYYYYLFIVGKKHVQSFSTDSMKGMINKSKFERIDFITPQITLQNQFAERIQAIEAQKQQAQTSLQKSEDLFNSLLQRAFKGELT